MLRRKEEIKLREESNSSDSDTYRSNGSDSTTSDSDSQPQPVVRTSKDNYAVNGKSKEITSTVLLSVDESDEIYPLVLTRPGELNRSHSVEKSYSMFYTLLSSNGSQTKVHLKESTFERKLIFSFLILPEVK